MHITPVSTALMSAICLLTPAVSAQNPALELQAAFGYARAFDGGGPSFAAALERPLSAATSKVQHALGGSLWYSQLSIASNPNSSHDRQMMGVGLRYQLALRTGRARPFIAVPVQLLRSNIPVEPTLQSSLSVSGVPNSGPARPVEDIPGSEWGWGAGLEAGLRVGLSSQLSAQGSVQGLYHKIYEAGTRNGAWTVQAGLSYQPGSRGQ
jgi:hypothetical protein